MQRMEMLLSKTPPSDIKSDVLPMIYRALESDTSQIQELCLSIIPGFAGDNSVISCTVQWFLNNVLKTELQAVKSANNFHGVKKGTDS
jgi:hypothetical protein